MNVNEKLIRVREQMELLGLDALLVFSEDPHGSEYPANYWKFREFLTGFNGSAGVLLITRQHVGLWTDSRYYIQAEKQLRGSFVELFKEGQPNVPDYLSYITYTLPSGSVVGVDGFTISYKTYTHLVNVLTQFGIRIRVKIKIIDDVFAPREELPLNEVIDVNFTETAGGQTRQDKIAAVRKLMLKQNATHYIISALDDVAWLTNLRCNDVEYNPVFYAYMIVTQDEEHLYIDPHKLTTAISRRLDEDNIIVSLYDHFEKNLSNLPSDARVYFNPERLNVRDVMALPGNVIKIEGPSLVAQLKCRKTATEIDYMRKAHVRDGVALTKFLCWLSDEINNNQRLTELDISKKILALRQEQSNFIGESFETISAYGQNAALCHYAPNIESNAQLKPEGFLLLDSGAQYTDGTTDITRTIALGNLSDQQRRDYTLVLKGHISLARVHFPYGTTGAQLDTMARKDMWRYNIDFGHGVGHGVGYCLNVHEGPQRISKTGGNAPFEIGMITSIEPGIYREGEYGIRIENLTVCQPAGESQFGQFLQLETISCCPIDTRPIIPEMLSDNEIEWLNKYHDNVRATLSPYLSDAEKAWLENATKHISKG
ncbi:MAG: aminopeptidase P family protein [Bacteroidales bacterium]|nr:aminopeptidase P family protein [Bacteroidales bacterium]